MLSRPTITGLTLLLLTAACSAQPAPTKDRDCAVQDDRYCNAAAGDLLDVRLGDLHPTQPSLGYDEVFFRVGRYTLGTAATPSPVFDAWCVANGQKGMKSAGPQATIADTASFTCEVPVGSETADTTAGMKTAVIGPEGRVYLTDGHHTLTSFWETPGGGPDTHIRVKIVANLKGSDPQAFWNEMQSRGWTWLRDAKGAEISPDQLPANLGLKDFANDPHRGVLFFLRDISYFQDDSIPAFQEFYWGHWLRSQIEPGLRLENFDLNEVTSYQELVGNIGKAMVGLPADTEIDGGRTAKELGKLESFGEKPFEALSAPLDSPKPGKLTYSVAYKAAH